PNSIDGILDIINAAQLTGRCSHNMISKLHGNHHLLHNKVSMGACLRDEAGAFVAAFSCQENGRYSAAEAEA
ncbi:hypothetical protein A2U01_0006562, partial [Trifolium medium]|nr:hypothetical protein [Trifolium medium]